jgi:hypothetical protein
MKATSTSLMNASGVKHAFRGGTYASVMLRDVEAGATFVKIYPENARMTMRYLSILVQVTRRPHFLFLQSLTRLRAST